MLWEVGNHPNTGVSLQESVEVIELEGTTHTAHYLPIFLHDANHLRDCRRSTACKEGDQQWHIVYVLEVRSDVLDTLG